MYGYELVESLERRYRGILALGQSTVYPLLYNLQAKGNISGRWREAASGRQRKYYSLTRKGHQRLAAETRQWQALLKVFSSLGVVAETSQGTVQGAS